MGRYKAEKPISFKKKSNKRLEDLGFNEVSHNYKYEYSKDNNNISVTRKRNNIWSVIINNIEIPNPSFSSATLTCMRYLKGEIDIDQYK